MREKAGGRHNTITDANSANDESAIKRIGHGGAKVTNRPARRFVLLQTLRDSRVFPEGILVKMSMDLDAPVPMMGMQQDQPISAT